MTRKPRLTADQHRVIGRELYAIATSLSRQFNMHLSHCGLGSASLQYAATLDELDRLRQTLADQAVADLGPLGQFSNRLYWPEDTELMAVGARQDAPT